jgi:hypothetical protein
LLEAEFCTFQRLSECNRADFVSERSSPRHIECSISSGDTARDEGPGEMMAMPFEEKASLTDGPRGIEAMDRCSIFAHDFKPLGNAKASFGKRHITLYGSQRIERR